MDYATILNQLQDYYSNLLIVQYNGKPKAQATIKELTRLVWANMVLTQIQDGFDWRSAKGKQLDIIGEWVGVTRSYNGSLFWDNTYFSYPNANNLVPTDNTDNLQHGYSDYETFNTDTGGVLTYNNLKYIEQSLNDDDYRTVIGLKIIQNNINHTAGNIDNAIWQYFNGQIYTTWQPHQIIYHYPAELTTIIEVCNYKNVLLAPSGVSIVLREI